MTTFVGTFTSMSSLAQALPGASLGSFAAITHGGARPATIAAWGESNTWIDTGVPLDWAAISNTPTTLAGYGITDAASKSIAISGGGLATGGGDLSANRTITVPISSQAEAEAGSDNATAMTPLRVAQAVAVLAPPAPVQSVAGRTGAVVLAKADVGLGNVDNTADTAKPVSTLQAAADAAVQAFAIQRANHTGSQAIGTITGLQTALDAKADDATTLAGYGITDAYTKTETDGRIQAVVGAAPAALDTLVEIATQLQADESAAAALTTTVAGKLAKASNLSDLADVPTARTNLGLGSAATANSTDGVSEGATNLYFTAARAIGSALTGFAAAGARTSILATDTILAAFGKAQKYLSDLGTAAFLNVGTGANQVVQLDGSAKLPAVDGSALTGLSSSDSRIPGTTVAGEIPFFTNTGGTMGVSLKFDFDSVNNALRLWNVTGTNYERAALGWVSGLGSNKFWIGTEVGGTGLIARGLGLAAYLIDVYTGGPMNGGAAVRWRWDQNGHFLAMTDNAYDIGASGANRPRNAYFAGTMTLGDGSTATPAVAWNNGGFYNLGLYKAATNAIGVATSGGNWTRFTDGFPSVQVRSDSGFAWASNTGWAAPDTGLSRTAAGKIAVGNGTAGNASGTLVAGCVGIGTSSPSALLDNAGDTYRQRTARTPASASDAGNAGDICWDSGNIYVCVATNTWKRAALSTW